MSDVMSLSHVKLLLVDDHPLFCDALSMTISDLFENPIIFTAETLKDAVKIVQENGGFNLVVLDLNLPDVDGVDGLLRLRSLLPIGKIVVVSSLSDNRIISSVMKAGASGFIPKDSPRETLLKAFKEILMGNEYVPLDFAEVDHQDKFETDDIILNKIKSLTPQQANILGLICEGKLNKQIAYDLTIAETTVKAHLTAILRKLNVQNRTQAVLIANKVSFKFLTDN